MLVLRVSQRKEIAATIIVPTIVAFVGGVFFNQVATNYLWPPRLVISMGVVLGCGLAALCILAVLACLAVTQWFYGSQTGFRVLGAFISSAVFITPFEVAHVEYNSFTGDYAIGYFLVLLPPLFLIMLAVCLVTPAIRRLVHGQVVEWWPGVCCRCGYQRQGSVSPFCPECGTPWLDDDYE